MTTDLRKRFEAW